MNALYSFIHRHTLFHVYFFAASEDFLTRSVEKTFTPGTTIECEAITILDDTILESSEEFFVQIFTRDDDQVSIDPFITTVTIIDQQDSKT